MRQLTRLLAYLRPYAPHFIGSVLLMAVVGAMESFRILLMGPIIDRVLNPKSPGRSLTLLPNLPGTHHVVYLQDFVPQHFRNPLTVVAVALVGTALIKGVCDYIGTYLVNHAGFGLITDLRNRLYDTILQRSTSFFSRHSTGMLVSTVVNDVEKVQVTLTIALPAFRERVRFESVCFSYGGPNGPETEILHNVNLETRAGEVVAIVGSSGAGKTTLVNLIPRFFDVTSGAIKIDGHDIRDVTLASLRTQIGVVTQETILFNDTVRNNVAYGQPHVTEEAVIEAAKAALAHDFIMRLPEGYDTMIGERGLRLSGGERQRIAIARALLKNAPILILDEATSSLDTESEALVQGALQNLISGRTVFVIAHRLTTVRHADRIVVLEGGRIADSGTHEDLLTRLGTYRKLYELQFMEIDPKMVDEPGIVIRETQIKN
jgi:ABC-type multidrug transport system fused ATPase/permease subunit